MNEKTASPIPVVRAPLFPTYRNIANAIRALDGEDVATVRATINAIKEQTGTPQNPVDWSDPDTWISERLTGEHRRFAQKVWETSDKTLNPRHMYGSYLFINRVNLLDRQNEVFSLRERGEAYLRCESKLLRELDLIEGLPKLLSLIAERSPCRRGDILPAWSDYLKAVSLFSTPSTFADTLHRRISHLTERDLISRDGSKYSITDTGMKWLEGFSDLPGPIAGHATPSPKLTSVIHAARAHNEEQLAAFKTRLMDLEAVQFEHFVKALLDAMEYQDVQVTKLSGDKGVDVIARVQFGITEITEVVQVKKTEITIGRPKVDELRGALPYHKAIRGTIISLGSFAKGAQEGALYEGAAPITLIDGKRLLELCTKHLVGVKSRPVKIYEIDEVFFREKFAVEETTVEDEGEE